MFHFKEIMSGSRGRETFVQRGMPVVRRRSLTARARSAHHRSAGSFATHQLDGTVQMRLIPARTVIAPTGCQRNAAASVMPVSILGQYRRRRAKRRS